MEGKEVLPVLQTDVLALPAVGTVSSVNGKVMILKNSSTQEGYRPLSKGDKIEEGDIVVLQERSGIEVTFREHKKISIATTGRPRWYTAKIEKSKRGQTEPPRIPQTPR
jgi:hypothetical protein